ncbi:SGNH/GDSL hydrolase family protein [Pseudooceanicola sp. 216_PA32_1]|uniref:SGNH/GDSL hydrolase family protein n=2 Tax=Pseudooceanicola pacificus TaxID=2676438 RepID=A0A844W6H1_9RHOB|nr:SGNH/GDSL hydrolase family protein [Pseudooceanicola pacificus]
MAMTNSLKRTICACACALGVAAAPGTVSAQSNTESGWVTTWSASPQPIWEGNFPLPTLLPFNLWQQTLRQPLRISLGGKSFRIVLSNEYGHDPLPVDGVSVAVSTGGGAIDLSTHHAVTFSGQGAFVIPAGAPMVSDPVPMEVASLSELAVSMHFSRPTEIRTFHWDGQETSYLAPGDQTGAAEMTDAAELPTRIFLSDILVEANPEVRGVVAYGDSITDGAASGPDLNARWPDFLAEALVGSNVAVVNAGISGARLLHSKMGENALARFDRDVLSRPNIRTVVLLMGINDISWPGQAFAPDDPFLTLDALKAAYAQLSARARMNGIRLVVGTLTPFKDALSGSPLEGYYSPERDRLRQELNSWIRSSDLFDAVVDLDRLVADPDDPDRIRADLQADHLHLSPEGNRVVAAAMSPDVLFGEDAAK